MKVNALKELIKQSVKEAIYEIQQEGKTIKEDTIPLHQTNSITSFLPPERKPSLLSPLQQALEDTKSKLTSKEIQNLQYNTTHLLQETLNPDTTTSIHSSPVNKLENDIISKATAIFGHLKDTNKLTR